MAKPPNNQTSDATAGSKHAAKDEGGGGSGSAPKSRKRSARVRPVYGDRLMKFYNVMASELSELATLSFFATFFIAAGSLFLGFGWDLWLTISGMPNAEPNTSAVMSLARNFSIAAAILCYIVAGGLMVRQFYRANDIKSETKFEE